MTEATEKPPSSPGLSEETFLRTERPEVSNLRPAEMFPDSHETFGLPILTSENREFIIQRAKEVLNRDKHILVIYIDVDSLKLWNEHPSYGREVGNQVIKHAAFAPLEKVNEVFGDREDIEIMELRQAGTADEIRLYVFGLNEKDLEQIESLREKLAAVPVIPPKEGRYDDSLGGEALKIGFSFSFGIATSMDMDMRQYCEETKNLIDQGKIDLPFGLIQELSQKAKDIADISKIKKVGELVSQLGTFKSEDIRFISEVFGYMRLGPRGLEALLQTVLGWK